jgi:CubicO group peptidase (beta-lactamase class C family)
MKFNREPSRLFVLVLFLFISACSHSQSSFPGKSWDPVNNTAEYGYSLNKLEAAKKYSADINTAAVVIVVNGKLLYEWGEVDKKYKTHSLRKSLLSAMYGNYVKDGTIDLDVTMADLGINDEPPLSEEELKATVRDCIKARSGIYHPALYESAGMKALKPDRFTEKAGAHWYYNNWDFNVAGTIFKNATGKDIYEAIESEIAKPIQMESFTAKDGEYVTGEESIHPAYPFRITAHDLARFGLLMLNNGDWNGKQVVPADWVEESTRYHSDATLYSSDGYGYMWWVSRDYNKFPHLPNVTLPEGTYSARGAGGHYVLIIPDYEMVIVHRVDTDVSGNRAASGDVGKLISMILEAKQ